MQTTRSVQDLDGTQLHGEQLQLCIFHQIILTVILNSVTMVIGFDDDCICLMKIEFLQQIHISKVQQQYSQC